MEKRTRASQRVRWVLFIFVLGLIVLSAALAVLHREPWVVPEAERERKNPLMASDANLAAAQEIYGRKCVDCHGEKGKGDGSEASLYEPRPSNLTDTAAMNKRTDGELFYQISEGRKPMPSFKKKLSEEQRWQLVLLMRWFASSGANGKAATMTASAPK